MAVCCGFLGIWTGIIFAESVFGTGSVCVENVMWRILQDPTLWILEIKKTHLDRRDCSYIYIYLYNMCFVYNIYIYAYRYLLYLYKTDHGT